MKKILLFGPLVAIITTIGISSCIGTVESSASADSVALEDTIIEESGEFLGGRTPWEEFTIESQNYGYANVRESPSKDAPVVKEIKTGEHFFGWRMPNNPDWIEVYDNKGITIGYMYYYCARHTGNKSENGDYAEYEETPQVSSNWEYRTTEDKLNDTRNYWAEIYSVDGQISCTVAELGDENGHYTTVWGVVWNDAYEKCYDKRKIGLKVPGDEKWRQIVIDCRGNSGTGDPRTNILINDKIVSLLRENKNFSILLGNDEYKFQPNAPLRQQHAEKAAVESIRDAAKDAAKEAAEAVDEDYYYK